MIDDSLAAAPHHCAPPDIVVLDDTVPGPFGTGALVVAHHEGTRFHCECGRVLIVWWRPGVRGHRVVVVGGYEWRPETRRERRQRLGLRWWQR